MLCYSIQMIFIFTNNYSVFMYIYMLIDSMALLNGIYKRN